MSTSLHFDIFGDIQSDVKVDMSELILSGHSFGGITAVTTAATLSSQPKAVVAFDPWFFTNHELFLDGKLRLKCPVQLVSSEHWLA